VSSVEVRGAGDLEDGLLERLVTRDRGWAFWRRRPGFDPDTLEDDVDRAQRYLRSEGFHTATVGTSVEHDPKRDRVAVTFDVVLGPPTLLARLDVEWSEGVGDHPVDLADATAALPLVLGERFGAHRYEAARDALLLALAEAGHPLASLVGGARVYLEDHTADVDWRVDPGPRVVIGDIRIGGLERADAVLVERGLTIEPGQPLRPSELRASERKVYGSGVFRSVAARPLRDRDPDRSLPELTWPVEVTVQERELRSIRLGGGYGTEDEFRVRGEWQHRNLFGQAESLDVTGKYSSLVAGAEVRYRDPSFIDPDVELEVPLGFERETEPGYDVNRTYIGAELGRKMFRHWRVAGGYRFELANPTDIDSDPFASNEDSVLISRLTTRLRRSDTNSLFEPTRGSILLIEMRPTLSALGSDYDSVEVRGGLRWYRAWRGIVLALRADAGTIEPVGGTRSADIPIFERYFSGGANSVRGYSRHLVGPLDADGDPLGGLTRAEASAELRVPIWRALGAVAFFDAGQIRTKPHDWSTHDIYPAWGGGLRLGTPVGPIRFDIGVPLKDGPKVNRFEIFLSVGHAF
jgi:outer membrane translocation and assembly module TamA